jgi:heptosyltransferase-3
MTPPSRLLISRTDAIGDVVLTLPVATILRENFPNAIIGFLGKSYTKPVVECSTAVDEFVDVEDFLKTDISALQAQNWDTIIHVFPRRDIARKAMKAGISQRLGTSSRLYHFIYCNKLVKLSRRSSELHEAQLNTRLLVPLGINKEYSKQELGELYSLGRMPVLPQALQTLLIPGKRYIILHPKSQGSAREWGLDHFKELVRMLPKERYQIFISGTNAEGKLVKLLLEDVGDEVTDITGKMDLATFISFIASCDALVAASTGPLHIAAALGKVAIGLYPSIRPMHAGRWGPIGEKAQAYALTDDCTKCRKTPQTCSCIRSISAAQVAQHIRTVLL